jgi:hypothetical protein
MKAPFFTGQRSWRTRPLKHPSTSFTAKQDLAQEAKQDLEPSLSQMAVSWAILRNRGSYTRPHTSGFPSHKAKYQWGQGAIPIRPFGPISSRPHSRYPGPQNSLPKFLALTFKSSVSLLCRSIY